MNGFLDNNERYKLFILMVGTSDSKECINIVFNIASTFYILLLSALKHIYQNYYPERNLIY